MIIRFVIFIVYIYIRWFVCLYVCLSAYNSGKGWAMACKFLGSSGVPEGLFLEPTILGLSVGAQKIYTFCFPLHRHSNWGTGKF